MEVDHRKQYFLSRNRFNVRMCVIDIVLLIVIFLYLPSNLMRFVALLAMKQANVALRPSATNLRIIGVQVRQHPVPINQFNEIDNV